MFESGLSKKESNFYSINVETRCTDCNENNIEEKVHGQIGNELLLEVENS